MDASDRRYDHSNLSVQLLLAVSHDALLPTALNLLSIRALGLRRRWRRVVQVIAATIASSTLAALCKLLYHGETERCVWSPCWKIRCLRSVFFMAVTDAINSAR